MTYVYNADAEIHQKKQEKQKNIFVTLKLATQKKRQISVASRRKRQQR